MKTCHSLQQFIEKIAEKYRLDLDAVGSYLRLDMAGADHYLVIETLGACRVSMARYLVTGLPPLADPEIILYTAYQCEEYSVDHMVSGWALIERLQRLGGWAIYADIDSQGKLVRVFDTQGQHDLVEYVETCLVPELQAQGWLTLGQRSTAPKPYLTPEQLWLRGITFAYNDEPADSATSLLMQKVAIRLASDHGVDLNQAGIQLVLSLSRRPEQLMITNHGDSRISVTRCIVTDDGQQVPDPDLIFCVDDVGGWQPEELLYSPAVWVEYVAVVGSAAAYTADGEVNFVSFTEYWAQRIIDAGWITQSQKMFEFVRDPDTEPKPQMPYPTQEILLVCDCPVFGSECGTWLELNLDGILTIEDKDGMRVSIMLPTWLEHAIYQAFQLHRPLSHLLLAAEIEINYRDDVPF